MKKHPQSSSRKSWSIFLGRLAHHGRHLRKLIPFPSSTKLQKLVNQTRPIATTYAQELANISDQSPLAAGRKAFAANKYAEALTFFSEALRLDKQNPYAHHGQGDALQLLGAYIEALHAYEQAIALNPKEGIHYGGRANALKALGRDSEANHAQEKALALSPHLYEIFRQH